MPPISAMNVVAHVGRDHRGDYASVSQWSSFAPELVEHEERCAMRLRIGEIQPLSLCYAGVGDQL